MRFCQAKHARGRESGHVRKPGSTKEDAPSAFITYILGVYNSSFLRGGLFVSQGGGHIF